MSLFKRTTSLAMIAGWTGCYQIAPFMLTPLAAWNYVVDRQASNILSTILTVVIIAPQDLPFT